MADNNGKKLAVVAVGGNALIKDSKRKSVPDQYAAASEMMARVADMLETGWNVIVTHGNGPQVGFILRRSELSLHELHPVPLDFCGADTQGAIGYMFQMALHNEFQRRGMQKHAATVVTQVLVDRNDPAFQNPTKPIGSFMDEAAAQKHKQENDWSVIEDAGRGWRRVVASPTPVQIVEQGAIMALVNAGFVVIGVGGGGIPVMKDAQGNLAGVEAVIDKDLASALLAASINADLFLISTEVEKVALNFNKPNQRWLDRMTLAEARQYLAEGHFGKGSMEPKIKAIAGYLERGGKEALVTNPEHIVPALRGETGTRITPK
ncbi:MAG: yahI [Anaerolineales bacterium]|nr:yahI [Anaerolineales bacterium]